MKALPQPEWSQAVEHLSAVDSKLAVLIAQVGPCTVEIPHHFSIFQLDPFNLLFDTLDDFDFHHCGVDFIFDNNHLTLPGIITFRRRYRFRSDRRHLRSYRL